MLKHCVCLEVLPPLNSSQLHHEPVHPVLAVVTPCIIQTPSDRCDRQLRAALLGCSAQPCNLLFSIFSIVSHSQAASHGQHHIPLHKCQPLRHHALTQRNAPEEEPTAVRKANQLQEPWQQRQRLNGVQQSIGQVQHQQSANGVANGDVTLLWVPFVPPLAVSNVSSTLTGILHYGTLYGWLCITSHAAAACCSSSTSRCQNTQHQHLLTENHSSAHLLVYRSGHP